MVAFARVSHNFAFAVAYTDPGLIVGIVLGVLAGVCVIVAGVFFFLQRKKGKGM